MLSRWFVVAAIACNAVGTAAYASGTLRGRIRPNRVTWFLWALAPLVAFTAQLAEGVGITSLTTLMVGLGPLVILGCSFIGRNAYWASSRFDLGCGGLSLLGLLFLALLRDGNISIALSITADACAAAPTVRKAFRWPDSEGRRVYLLAVASAAITLLTVDGPSFAACGFPAYMLVLSGTLFAAGTLGSASRPFSPRGCQ
ncbi:hypothetical protein [Parafrankia discariae]|uniref:hypothetical protein n=1 Tax=Parafrankia discariae TaxID=365528 RepID=UPI000379B7E6|nr:hypothetical protein [Parafrankia discariae]